MTAPAAACPVFRKMAYYRTQHTSRGVRLTHMIGTPVIAAGSRCCWPNREQECQCSSGAGSFKSRGTELFEHNMPSTHKGWITYQLTGVIHVCEQYGGLLARRSQRKAARRPAVRVPA